jgi:membrane protease YdiL (CAAX protease family)
MATVPQIVSRAPEAGGSARHGAPQFADSVGAVREAPAGDETSGRALVAPVWRLVAPLWHTALLVAFFLVLAAGGALFQKSATAESSAPSHAQGAATLYLSILAAEWGLLYYVWKAGLKRTGTTLRELVGGRWACWRDVGRDAALAAGLWATWKLASLGVERFMGPDHAAGIGSFLPRQPLEIGLWVLVSITAGITEEIVFRGYLQRQFTALTRSRWIGLLIQAALFGISHGYQGLAACGRIALFGAFFGGIALWRRSLRPGIIAHAGTDILAGLFRI